MNAPVRIVVAGEAVPLRAPQFHNIKTRDGRSFVSAYQPSHVKKYQTHVRMKAEEVMREREPLTGPLVLVATFVMPVPKSFSKRRHGQALVGAERPITRPDCSNLLKALEDAMTGIVYRDDSQIVEVYVRKMYGDKPQMSVEVRSVVAGEVPRVFPQMTLFHGAT
jgi:Holliday junction resolvase RusA-like endonuclease